MLIFLGKEIYQNFNDQLSLKNSFICHNVVVGKFKFLLYCISRFLARTNLLSTKKHRTESHIKDNKICDTVTVLFVFVSKAEALNEHVTFASCSISHAWSCTWGYIGHLVYGTYARGTTYIIL